MTRITFPGYTHEQLRIIIQSRLEGVPGDIVDPDAVQFASRKVAAVSGDARRALDICRRAVEIAENDCLNQDSLPSTPCKIVRKGSAAVQGREARIGRVTISTVKQAINEATSCPLQQCLKSLPLASKLFLAALLARIRRTGIMESFLGDVIAESKRLGDLMDDSAIRECLLTSPTFRTDRLSAARTPAMGTAAHELMEAGIINMEPRSGELIGKIRLNIGEDELRFALKEDHEVRGLGFTL